MTPLVEKMFLNEAVVGNIKFGLVKKEIPEPVMDKTVIPNLHCLANMALAAVDDHGASISHTAEIADGIGLGAYEIFFLVLKKSLIN